MKWYGGKTGREVMIPTWEDHPQLSGVMNVAPYVQALPSIASCSLPIGAPMLIQSRDKPVRCRNCGATAHSDTQCGYCGMLP